MLAVRATATSSSAHLPPRADLLGAVISALVPPNPDNPYVVVSHPLCAMLGSACSPPTEASEGLPRKAAQRIFARPSWSNKRRDQQLHPTAKKALVGRLVVSTLLPWSTGRLSQLLALRPADARTACPSNHEHLVAVRGHAADCQSVLGLLIGPTSGQPPI